MEWSLYVAGCSAPTEGWQAAEGSSEWALVRALRLRGRAAERPGWTGTGGAHLAERARRTSQAAGDGWRLLELGNAGRVPLVKILVVLDILHELKTTS